MYEQYYECKEDHEAKLANWEAEKIKLAEEMWAGRYYLSQLVIVTDTRSESLGGKLALVHNKKPFNILCLHTRYSDPQF